MTCSSMRCVGIRLAFWVPGLLLGALAATALAATIGPPKQPYPDRDDDRRCVHRELIAQGRHEYVVPFRGTVTVRRGYPIGHVVGEVFYDGGYHMLDSDEHVICLLRDNQTIASEEDIVRDHDLVKRTHTYGIGQGESRQTDEFSASLYSYEGERTKVFPLATKHAMTLVLRPGESLEYRWDHVGKQYTAGLPVQDGQRIHDGLGELLAGWGKVAYDNLRNGRLCYRPDLSDTLAQQGVEAGENVIFDVRNGQVRSETADRPAQVTWRFRSPYVFVGGQASATLELGENAGAEWRYSTDGQTWSPLSARSGQPPKRLTASLDQAVSPRTKPTYDFLLQLSLRGSGAVKDLLFEIDVQTATLGLPELCAGENRIAYTDDSTGDRQVQVLRCRTSPTSSYNAAFWDREEFSFKGRPPARRSVPRSRNRNYHRHANMGRSSGHRLGSNVQSRHECRGRATAASCALTGSLAATKGLRRTEFNFGRAESIHMVRLTIGQN